MSRDAIQAFINEVGASPKSGIARATGLAKRTLTHHLHGLSRDGVVVLQYWGNQLWAFHPSIREDERFQFVSTNRPSSVKLLDFLLGRKPATVNEISAELRLSQQTVRKQLSHLLYAGQVERSPVPPHRFQVVGSEGELDEVPPGLPDE